MLTFGKRRFCRLMKNERSVEVVLEIEGDESECRSFGTIESAIEYINHRPHENFIIYNVTQSIIDEIRQKVRNTINKG